MTGCDVLLRDGTPVHLRPIEPRDATGLIRFHARLSPETTRMRFFTLHPYLSDSEVTRFTEVDHRDREALVAELEGEIIGVGRYDRLPGTDDAEVAFVIEDRWQGTGLGTLLLEHMAPIAGRAGITRFIAETLGENNRMRRMLNDAGVDTTTTWDHGIGHTIFPIETTESARQHAEAFEHTAEAASIARLLRPESVAVIGASTRPETVGHQLTRNLRDGGFNGPIYPINRKAADVLGMKAYPSILDVPGPVDLAIIAVPVDDVEGVVDDCAAAGVHGVVVVSAGFAETGPDGVNRQHRLVEAARKHGLRVIGPNCVGIANPDPAVRLQATFGAIRPKPGHVGILSQSGAVGIALLDAITNVGVGVSSFVSVGNKADVSGNDFLQYWEDDDATSVICLYLESFGNPRKFARLARRVGRRKPIVAVKSGRTAAGTRAASSHTAALAADDTVVDALFHQSGVIRVDTVRELIDVAMLLASQPVPAGRRVAIVGNSGGPGIMAADACATAGLDLALLSNTTQVALDDVVPSAGASANPVDMLAAAAPEQYEHALDALLTDPGVDGVVVIHTPTLLVDPDDVAAGIGRAAARNPGTPLAAAFLATPPGSIEAGPDHSVPRYEGVEEAVAAMGRAAAYGAWRTQPTDDQPDLVCIDDAAARTVVSSVLAGTPAGRWLQPQEAEALLGSFGIHLWPSATVADVEAAVEAAGRLGYPVALKVVGEALVHKTDVGGVALDLEDEAAVRAAWDAVQRAAGPAMTGALVQPMAGHGVETIAGVSQDPTFGPLVVFGLGGTTAELLRDQQLHLVPVTAADARVMVRSLRGSPLFFGYRGARGVDVAALEDLLLRLGRLADEIPEVAELDLNPVIARPEGLAVVDAKVRVAPAPARTPEGLRQLPPPR